MHMSIPHDNHVGDDEKLRFTIETLDDYELATQRIAALDNAIRSQDDDHERDALVEAVKHWDAKHDDPTSWKD